MSWVLRHPHILVAEYGLNWDDKIKVFHTKKLQKEAGRISLLPEKDRLYPG
jgi:hypothetical protein